MERANVSEEARERQQYPALLRCFSPEEQQVLRQVLRLSDVLSEPAREDVHHVFRQASRSLPPLQRAMSAYRISPADEKLGGRIRSAESLLESLCQEEWLPSDFSLPTGTVLGRALVVARINFLKALKYAVNPAGTKPSLLLLDALQEILDDAIYYKLAEELLTATLANPRNALEIRRLAAGKVLAMWKDPTRHELGDFPRLLPSAWKARQRVQAVFGTLLGSAEVLSLLREQCEVRFLNFFMREQATTDEIDALREFLFGLPYEELQEVTAYMEAKGLKVISREQVYGLVGKTVPVPTSSVPTAEELFASYTRRRVRAEYRALSTSPGPKKTAEGYIMEALLREELAGKP